MPVRTHAHTYASEGPVPAFCAPAVIQFLKGKKVRKLPKDVVPVAYCWDVFGCNVSRCRVQVSRMIDNPLIHFDPAVE